MIPNFPSQFKPPVELLSLTCDSETKEQFSFLLQCSSPKTLLEKTPTLSIHDCQGTILKILNFTDYIFSFNEERVLCVNNKLSNGIFTADNCHIVVYPLVNFVCCMETRDDDKAQIERIFLVDMHKYSQAVYGEHADEENLAPQFYVTDRSGLHNKFAVYSPALIYQRSFQVLNAGDYERDPDFINLERKIPREAVLKRNPTVSSYSTRIHSQFFTIVNHTKNAITFDIENGLRVNTNHFHKFSPESRKFIAYELKDNPETICLETKIQGAKEIERLFFCLKGYGYVEENFAPAIFKTADARFFKLEADFKALLPAYHDEKSFFVENNIPKEILGHIMHAYTNS